MAPDMIRYLHGLYLLIALTGACLATPEAGRAKPLRVGIYDNDPIIFTDRLGRPSGFFIDILEHIAAETFRQSPQDFDPVITDMTMPHMTGDTLAREILKIRPGCPIIISTGYSERLAIRRAEAIGIRGFAQKPIVLKELARLVRQALA